MTDKYILRAKARRTYGPVEKIIHVSNAHGFIEPMTFQKWHKLTDAERYQMGYNYERARHLNDYYKAYGMKGYDEYETEIVQVR